MSIYEQLRVCWKNSGVNINDGIAKPVIDTFEEKHRVHLPCPFKDYLLTVNGMRDGDTDDNLVSFFSLEKVDQGDHLVEISTSQVEIIVADCSLFSHWYILRTTHKGNPACVVATNGEVEKVLASSFENFVAQYLADQTKVAHCFA